MDYAVLEVRDLSVGIGKFEIRDISFTLKNGDILGLVGRSGSGKSTLIKALLGRLKIKKGEITFSINGNKSELNKTLGYSPQDNSIFPLLTLEENLETFGKLYGLSKEQISKNAEPILKMLDLEKHVKKKIIEMSGGMQKRSDLAVTLIHNPDVIILDEPFNGLDISLQKFIWMKLRELSKAGKIIIICSHILEDIRKYCNNYGLIESGTYYDSNHIISFLKNNNMQLEEYLEKLFISDLEREK